MGNVVNLLPVGDRVFIDPSTGEMIQGVLVYVGAKVKWKEGWFMAIQDAFIALAKDKDIRGRTRAVLDYLMGKLAFENYIAVTQQEISEELGIEKTHISSSIKILCEKGIISKGPKLGHSFAYKLNSNFGWKGKIKNLDEERRKRLKLISSNQNKKENSDDKDEKTIDWIRENNSTL